MSCLRVGLVGGGPAIVAVRDRLRGSALDIEIVDAAEVGGFDTGADRWDGDARCQVIVTTDPPPDESYLGIASHRHPNLFHVGHPAAPPPVVARYVGSAVEELILAGASRVQVRLPIERSWLGYVRATGGGRKMARKIARFDANDYDYTSAALRDDDVYDGPVVIAHDSEQIATRMRVQGYFDPLDGHFHWAGIAFGDQVRALKDARVGAVEVAVGGGEAVPARLAEITPWGTVRITGVGQPPYPLEDVDVLVPSEYAGERDRFGHAGPGGIMAKEINKARTQAMKQTVAAHPGMVAFALAPAVVVFGVLWLLTNFWLALLVGVVVGGGAAYTLLRK